MAEDPVTGREAENPYMGMLQNFFKQLTDATSGKPKISGVQMSGLLGGIQSLTGLTEKGMGISSEEKRTGITEAGATERAGIAVKPHMDIIEQSKGMLKGKSAVTSLMDKLKMGLSGNSLISGQGNQLPSGFDSSTHSMIWDTPVNTAMAKSFGWMQ